jgi:hypothetical protein
MVKDPVTFPPTISGVILYPSNKRPLLHKLYYVFFWVIYMEEKMNYTRVHVSINGGNMLKSPKNKNKKDLIWLSWDGWCVGCESTFSLQNVFPNNRSHLLVLT